MPVSFDSEKKCFYLSGGNVSYVLHVDAAGRLLNLHWGKKVQDCSVTPDLSGYPGFASFDLPEYLLPHEVPVRGSGWYGTPAVDVLNAQGNDVVVLKYVSHSIYPGKKGIPGLPATYVEADGEAESLEILLADELTGLIGAAAKMRPSKSCQDMELSSLKKKFKDKKEGNSFFGNKLKKGESFYVYRKGEVYPREIRYNPQEKKLEVGGMLKKAPDQVSQPTTGQKIAAFFGGKQAKQAVANYEKFLKDEKLYEKFVEWNGSKFNFEDFPPVLKICKGIGF